MKKVSHLFLSALLIPMFLFPGLASADDKQITIGGKNYTEAYLLAELATILLDQSGFDVTQKTGVGSVIARQSLENRQIDLYFDYTGTAYTVYYKGNDMEVMTDAGKIYNWIKTADEKKGIIWLDPIPFNNTYTLMMKATQADALGIKSISDLGQYVSAHPDELIFALDSEFWERPDGFKKVMQTYNFTLPPKQVKKMSLGLTYQALRDGLVNSAMGFATDGRIAAFGFVNLVDDKSFFPVYNPAVLVRAEVLEKYPEIRSILKPLAEHLTTDAMQQINAAVDVEHKDVHEVALAWLKGEGLVK